MEFKPDVAAIEDAKDNKGFTSHQKQVELAGSIKRVLVELNIPYVCIAPSTMKKAITGNGWSDKEEVARRVCMTLGLRHSQVIATEKYKSGAKKGSIKSLILDGSDALGLALAFPDYVRRIGVFEFRGVRPIGPFGTPEIEGQGGQDK